MVLGDLSSLAYLLLAVVLGAVVGLENEYRMQGGTRIYLGLRTCIFISLLGYVFSLLYQLTGDSLMLVAAIGTITVIASSIYIEKSNIVRDPGATTYTATFIIFAAGMLVGLGYYEYAVVLSVLTAAISFYKREFLEFIHKIRRRELIAALNLLIIAFVILPLLPNQYIGPGALFNPFEFWLIVATVGLIFFLQYSLLRISKYGLFLSSFVGSIITGTAVAFTLVKMAGKAKNAMKSLFYNVMFSTNLPMILIQGTLFLYLTTLSTSVIYYALPSIITALALITVFLIFGRKSMNLAVKKPTNPFPIRAILQFAVLFFVIFTVSRAVAIVAPQFLPITLFVSALGNVSSAAFSLGFLFLQGNISAQYAGFLLGLMISAGLLSKIFVGVVSKDKALRWSLIGYSALIGILTLSSAAFAFYGI